MVQRERKGKGREVGNSPWPAHFSDASAAYADQESAAIHHSRETPLTKYIACSISQTCAFWR